MRDDKELVLGISADKLFADGEFSGICSDTERIAKLLNLTDELEFRPRSECEADPSFKQFIPYVVMCQATNKGIELFTYSRAPISGEQRLVGKRSLGVGGHINPCDTPSTGTKKLSRYVDNAMLRELKEEVDIVPKTVPLAVGLIYDPSNAVGQVHVGLFHMLFVEMRSLHPEKSMHDAKPINAADIVDCCIEEYETWSKMVMSYMMSGK